MAKLTQEQITAAIYSELQRATDYGATSLRDNRRNAWNYYLNRKRGDEVTGRSSVQDTSVRDVTHALLAAIMPAYAVDNIISLEPFGPNDVDQAEAESKAINSLFTETNKGYLELSNAVQDCLLFRNGTIKCWIEESTEINTRSFRAAAADVLAQAPPDEEWTHTGTEDGLATFEIKRQVNKLHTDAIEQAMLFVDPNQSDQDLNEANFIGELSFLTRSDLRGMGISKKIVDALPATPDKANTSGVGTGNTDILAKYIDGVADISGASTRDRDEIECYWVHMKIDTDGDGISERWRFLVSARQILLQDQVDYFPYASGTGWPVSHRWSGLSVYDLNRITQDERTNARRQLADNLNVANNQRPVYDPGSTETEDVTNSAPGRGIRSRDPGSVHFMPVADIVGNSIQFLQYMDGVRSEQSGAALDMQSADGQLLSTASGISAEMQLAPRELMAAHISRNIAETLVRNLFLLIHKTLRTDWNQPIMFSKSGDWQQTDPAEWQPRSRLNINIGLSPGERRRKSAALQQVMQTQLMMIQSGNANIITDLNGVHSAITDWMRSVELDGSEGYFLDPQGQQSQQAQQVQQQQAQAQEQQQTQMQALMLQLEKMDRDLEAQKVANDDRQARDELRWKYFDSLLDADAEDARIESQERTGDGAEGVDSGNGAARAN